VDVDILNGGRIIERSTAFGMHACPSIIGTRQTRVATNAEDVVVGHRVDFRKCLREVERPPWQARPNSCDVTSSRPRRALMKPVFTRPFIALGRRQRWFPASLGIPPSRIQHFKNIYVPIGSRYFYPKFSGMKVIYGLITQAEALLSFGRAESWREFETMRIPPINISRIKNLRPPAR